MIFSLVNKLRPRLSITNSQPFQFSPVTMASANDEIVMPRFHDKANAINGS
jgi:hypothetical protein